MAIQRRLISVFGICTVGREVVYVGRWQRGSAVERGQAYKEADYGWWIDCVAIGDTLFVFGYDGGAINLSDMRIAKRVPHISAEHIATDGKFIYVATPAKLLVFDKELNLAGSIKENGLRDVAVAEDGTVYVLSQKMLYVYDDGKLKPAYKTGGSAHFVQPHDDGVYLSTLRGLVRLDGNFQERAFSSRLARSFAVLGDHVVSFYDNTIVVAERKTLSIEKMQLLNGLSAGFTKAHTFGNAVLVPVYFKDENAVLSLTL